MSLLDTNVPAVGGPVMTPTQYVNIPIQVTSAETSNRMNGWYDWLVNHVPPTIRREASSIFNATKGRISSLFSSPSIKPTKYVKEPIRENISKVSNKISTWQDWLVNHIPEPIRRNVSSAFQKMKDKIMKLYDGNKPIPEPALQPGVEGNAQRWCIDGSRFSDPVVFLEATRDSAENVINSADGAKKVSAALTCQMRRTDPGSDEVQLMEAVFRSRTHRIITPDDTTVNYREMMDKMLEEFSKFQKLGSGWVIEVIDSLCIYIAKYNPLKGGCSGISNLPEALKNKHALTNMMSTDSECFKWSCTRALNPIKHNTERITKILKKQAEKLNWDGLEYPVKLTNIEAFEAKNSVGVNILSCDDDNKYAVYPLRITRKETDRVVNMFLWDNHYYVIKDMSRLLSTQHSKRGHKLFPCVRCINMFSSQEILDRHIEDAHTNSNHQRCEYPKIGDNGDVPTVRFTHIERIHPVPFTITFDFEGYVVGINTETGKIICEKKKSSTVQYQKHEPSGFCYLIKCIDNNIYPPKIARYTSQYKDDDIPKKFVEMLEDEVKDIYTRFKTPSPIYMVDGDSDNHNSATECYACRNEFTDGKYKVKDHCHITGKYRGAACNKCNLKMIKPKFITAMAHNLEGYDAHLFVRNLGVSEGDT